MVSQPGIEGKPSFESWLDAGEDIFFKKKIKEVKE